MLGVFLPGSSLTILLVCVAVLPVSAASAAGAHAPSPAVARATSSTKERSFRTPTIPRVQEENDGVRAPVDASSGHTLPTLAERPETEIRGLVQFGYGNQPLQVKCPVVLCRSGSRSRLKRG